jgi:hypothetical protein
MPRHRLGRGTVVVEIEEVELSLRLLLGGRVRLVTGTKAPPIVVYADHADNVGGGAGS